MKKILLFLLLVPMVSFGQTKDSINQYKALRLKNELGFQKSYRILKLHLKA